MLEILKRILLGVENEETIYKFINNDLSTNEIKYLLEKEIPPNVKQWVQFEDLQSAFSMIGYERMTNLENIINDVIENNITGNIIETGVWKGGACMFIKYMLNHLKSNKKVYVADSFQGLPKPNAEKYSKDSGDTHHLYEFLSISEDQVKENFKRFNLLDDNVV